MNMSTTLRRLDFEQKAPPGGGGVGVVMVIKKLIKNKNKNKIKLKISRPHIYTHRQILATRGGG